MSTLWQEIKIKMLHSRGRIPLLIGINLIVFVVINVLAVIEWLFKGPGLIRFYTDEYLLLPAAFQKLLIRFWTPLTYMFMHAGPFHVLFNMLWLYWFGQIFEEYLGNKRTVGLYLLSGLAGALFFELAFNFLPAFAGSRNDVIVGASAAVMGIIVATATLLPDYAINLMLIGEVKLKWIAIFYVVLDFILISSSNPGGEIAHLGGALFGFIYIKQLQRGNDWVGAIAGIFKPRSKMKVAARNTDKNSNSKPRQDEIDRILDKISQAGYDSLNKQEKEILFRASKDNEG